MCRQIYRVGCVACVIILLSATLLPAQEKEAGPSAADFQAVWGKMVAKPAQEKEAGPSAAEVAAMLKAEPFSLATWPAWKPRLLSWIKLHSDNTDAAFEAARQFALSQYKNRTLPPELNRDYLAWYLVGRAYMKKSDDKPLKDSIEEAEFATKQSLGLKEDFAYTHRNLAMLMVMQFDLDQQPIVQAKFQQYLNRCQALDPTMAWEVVPGMYAMSRKQFQEAEMHYRRALQKEPTTVQYALGIASAVVSNNSQAIRAMTIRSLCEKFPDNGALACFHGLALAMEDRPREALVEFERARKLGTPPETVFDPKLVAMIKEQAQPGWLESFGWLMVGFVIVYSVVILAMATAGWLLSMQTRGAKALQLLGVDPHDAIMAGQVVRTQHESALATLYGLSLFAGLLLFYVSVPFVLLGLLAVTGGALLAIFQLGRIPIKLVLFIILIGGGMIWSVLKSVFSSPGSGGFGILKSKAECPQLHALLGEVAARIDTNAVDEVYLAPGSAIGVHQEGRGPFGIFGVKKRVLTLGLCTMHFLTISELKAILAHEYAHFSHKDTFYSRFIYQVQMSIENALNGMAAAGGWVNYVNPFYWFFYLYYKAYSLLSAGYSRSREFLADRMAASLYGSDVFTSALRKVTTDGQLFEATMYENIGQLLSEQKALVNMYEAFRSFREEHIDTQEREDLYKKLLDEKSSLFASHPTFAERVEALAGAPQAVESQSTTAMHLFEKPAELEQEMTDFLTAVMRHARLTAATAG